MDTTGDDVQPGEAGGSHAIDLTSGSPGPEIEPSGDPEPAAVEPEPEEESWQGRHAELPDPEPENTAPEYQRFDCTAGDASQLFAAADAARQAIERGQCIVMATDTVYGIGADAFNPDAVQRLLDAKARGRDMPPPVLIADAKLIRVLAVDVPRAAHDLIDRHWPGALTVICQAQPSLRLDLGDADGTIALRVPDHALAREILRQTGPMAVSSANRSGQPAATTCDEAVRQLGNGVSVYLDGGQLGTRDAAPSTIVDFTQNELGSVLRHGALSVELLRETCPDLEDLVEPVDPINIKDPVDPEDPVDPIDPIDPVDPVRHAKASPADSGA